MTTIYLLRHGQTDLNFEGKLQGRMNTELNKEGLKQANTFRKTFLNYDVDICYSSPLIRAIQTAFTVVGDRCLINRDDRLIERFLGDLEGEKRVDYDVSKYWDYELNSSEYGIEAIKDVYDRSKSFLDYIIKKYPNKRILIVSHGAVIRCMHNILNNYSYDNFKDVDICNCYFEEINIK